MLTSALMTERTDSHSDGRTAPSPTAHRRVRLSMDFTDPQLAVLTVAGDLDVVTTPRFAELVWPRLQTELTTLVLDFSEVSFLGVDALQLLSSAHTYATVRGITLCVINSTPTVERALTAAGLDTTLPCFADLPTARRALIPSPATPVAPQRTPSHR